MSKNKPQQLYSKFATALKFDKLFSELDKYDDHRRARIDFFIEYFKEDSLTKSEQFNQFVNLLCAYVSNMKGDLISLGYQMISNYDLAFVTIINDLHDEVY